ncbi:hypothetical protein AB1N83_004720 [Pleurotus pulmonarius]
MSPLNHTAAKDLENKLFPPAGTSFFESETITVFDEVELTRPSGLGATSHVEMLTWRPEVYKGAEVIERRPSQFPWTYGSV